MVRLMREHVNPRQAAVTPGTLVTTKATHAGSQNPVEVRGKGLLTLKEREVLTLLNSKLSNKEIALALSISEETVKWHMKNLFLKLHAASRKHAIARARLLGLVDS
jgi:LuxR family maltose regulon positive regulatory protein